MSALQTTSQHPRRVIIERTIGDSFESFLAEQGIRDDVDEHAIKAVLAWQLRDEMKRQHLSKAELARRLGTS